jgi:lipoprotein-anchoring transpeptidase ErfK/SrfK
MNQMKHTALALIFTLSALAAGCTSGPGDVSRSASPSPGASPEATTKVVSNDNPVTLPVLDALLSEAPFKSQLKLKLQLTDDQIAQLQKIAGDEVARLRQANAEGQASGDSSPAQLARAHAAEAIRGVIGPEKVADLFAIASDYWIAGNAAKNGVTEVPATLPTTPNSVPTDTRVVVNIPAFRMDVFKDGTLVKSYKVGIGYPEFPLPTGVRKAETIIFNPTWTPPDEPWVAHMKNVSVGEKVAAGSKLNPLGPIKIPIGAPSLIHGGKSPAKIGTFASHGCVGLTNAQVEDFAKVLAEAAGSELSDATIQSYFKNRTRTQVVKLKQVVPVELRYETIVLEDGQLHIYRDVYDQNTNTEAKLRAVLEANNLTLEELSDAERADVLAALNAMSRHPLKQNETGKNSNKSANAAVPLSSPAANPNQNSNQKSDQKTEVAKARKPVGKNQKEVVIELTALKGKGYPAALNLSTGTGKPAAVAVAKPN